MKKQCFITLVALFVVLSLPIHLFAQEERPDNEQITYIYRKAVKDASRNLSSKDIYTKLISLKYGASKYAEWNICKKDTMILVASFEKDSWKAIKSLKDSVFQSPDNLDDMVWIFIPKEMEKRMADFNHKDTEASLLRLKQMLGLPPCDKYTTIYYFWVSKDSLLRPSFNSDITATKSSIAFPKNVDPKYKEWLTKFISDNYNNPNPENAYPFTRLGYTYDWSPQAPRYGLSEFIIKPNTPLRFVKKVNIASGEWW